MKKKYINYNVDGDILATGVTDEATPPAFFPMICVGQDVVTDGMMVDIHNQCLKPIPPKSVATTSVNDIKQDTTLSDYLHIVQKDYRLWNGLHLAVRIFTALVIGLYVMRHW